MLELITDIEDLSSMLHVNVRKRYLSVSLNLDAYKNMSPKIAKIDDKNFLISRHIEKGNILAHKEIEEVFPSNFEIFYYNPYFTFEGPSEKVYSGFIEALNAVSKKKEVIVQQGIPLSLYQALVKEYKVYFNTKENKKDYSPKFFMYILTEDEVLNKFNNNRNTADKIAINIIANSPVKEDLINMIKNRTDSRFKTLNELMQKENINSILCTSPLGVQEISGYGIKHYKEDQIAALYIKGENNIYLFSKQPLGPEYEDAKEVNIFEEIASRTNKGDALGVEEEHYPAGWLNEARKQGIVIKNAMSIIKQSREERGWEDLSYHIIASRASVYATDGAFEWAEQEIKNSKQISELDINNKYEALLKIFKENNSIPFNIEVFWTNCHAGNRSNIPSFATNYFLNSDNKTLKIDAGVSIIDDFGIHRAASDIARTLIIEKEAREAYKKLEKFMLKDVIPGVKPEMKGKEIYKLAVSKIEEDKEFFKDMGLLSPDINNFEEMFNRDVGHLLGLQEPVTHFFDKKAEQKVKMGMTAAIEYQWSTNNYSIGIEDNFVIGSSGGLNYSRDI